MMDQVIDSDMVYLIQSCLDCRRVAYYVKHTDTRLDIDIDIHKSTAEESAVLLSTNLLSNNNVSYLLHDVPKRLLDDDISDKSILKDVSIQKLSLMSYLKHTL